MVGMYMTTVPTPFGSPPKNLSAGREAVQVKNCSTYWKDLFEQKEDASKVCSHACHTIQREVKINEVETRDGVEYRVCVCTGQDKDKDADKDEDKDEDNDKQEEESGPCAVAGMDSKENDLPECPCPNFYDRPFPMFFLIGYAAYGAFVIASVFTMIIQCCAQSILCCVGCSKPVQDESDIHWARCCCSAGGAFCCIPKAKLPAIQSSVAKIYGCVVLDLLAASTGFPGLGIALLGYLSANSPSEHRAAYYRVGLIYIACQLVIGVLYFTMVFALLGYALSIWISWAYVMTLGSLIRLPCQRSYAARWLSPNASRNSSNTSFQDSAVPAVITVPFSQIAAEPLLVAKEVSTTKSYV